MNVCAPQPSGDDPPLLQNPEAERPVVCASTLNDLRPGLGCLARAIASGEDHDVVAAARALDLTALAAFLYPAEPILVPLAKSSPAKAGDPVSDRVRLAERLMRLDVNPRLDLTTWDHDFIASAVATLRADLPLSERQTAVVERLFKMRRRRLS